MSDTSFSGRRKIAILQTAFLGDTLLTVPLAKNLIASEVLSEDLAIICRKGYGELLRETGLFGKVLEIEKGKSETYALAKSDLNQWWKSASSRLLLSPHESPRSRLWAAGLRLQSRLLGKDPVITVGYRSRPFGVLSFLYTRKLDRQMRLPEALRQLLLLQADDFLNSDLWRERLSGFLLDSHLPGGLKDDGTLASVPEWASMEVSRFSGVAKNPRQVAFAPGSVWATKQWTQDGYTAVGIEAIRRGFKVVIVGTKEERELCDKIAFRINEVSVGSGAESFAGRLSLIETADVIAKSEIAYVNDSGAMHLASLAGTKSVCFFGPTVLDFGYRPWNNNAVVLQAEEKLNCRPCGLHGAQKCPIGTHTCMKSIEPNRAIQHLD
ncbi:MAG: glycosyltransferase family 9 protein [Deltaproteobacteria bacterium]|nr:glycosyltransferase family 9 protein [Deltaproteobacteria bacterium]